MIPQKAIIHWPMPKDFDLYEDFSPLWSNQTSRLSLGHLYDNLEKSFDTHNIASERLYRTYYQYKDNEFIIPNDPNPEYVYLSYHTHSKEKVSNIFHVHNTSIPGYFTIDPLGYGGFSTTARCDFNYINSDNINQEIASDWYENFIPETKLVQHKENLTVSRPFVFIAGQTKDDEVIKELSNVDAQEYYNNIVLIADKLGYDTVFKPHPSAKHNIEMGHHNSEFYTPKGAIEFNGDFRDAVAESEAVFVMNSSVGMESLFYDIPVFTGGECDYKWVTNRITDINQLYEISIENHIIDMNRRKKFLFHMINNIYLDAYDRYMIMIRISNLLDI